MRCPKCHYLSFDPEPRCKNCGFDLEVADAELAFKAAEEYSDDGPDLELRKTVRDDVAAPVTLELVKPVAVADPPPLVPIKSEVFADLVSAHDEPAAFPPLVPIRIAEPEPEPQPVVTTPPKAVPAPKPVQAAAPVPQAVPPASPHPTTELPLFVRENAPARPPLAVRRNVTDLPKPKSRISEPPKPIDRRVGPLAENLLEDLRRVEREEQAHIKADARAPAAARARVETPAAMVRDIAPDREEAFEIPATQRLAAAALDGLLLGGIGTFVLWATLRVTGVGLTSLGFGSLLPFGIFLTGVCVAYLLMFTAAGGQTLGKMLMGLRVVGDDTAPDARLTLGQAALRAVVAPFSVMALGLGWVPALFGKGLALHDRLAHTRVVRA